MEIIVNPTEEQTRCIFVKALKEIALELVKDYERNIKIEVNVPIDKEFEKIKVNITEYDL